MSKTKIISFLIIVAIIFLVVVYYYINKQASPITTTDKQGTEKTAEPEKTPFNANDNLDQAIEELKVIDGF